MSEKRFTMEDGVLKDNGEPVKLYGLDDLLNSLVDENRELQKENKKLEHKANFWHKKYRQIKSTIMHDDE